MATVVEGDPKGSFSIPTTPKCTRGHNSFPDCFSFPLIHILNAEYKARSHQAAFLNLWYDFNWDWTPVSRVIGKYSTLKANRPINHINWLIGQKSRLFTYASGDRGSIPGRIIPRTQKNGTWCYLAQPSAL